MFIHDGDKVFIYIIATSGWWISICPFSWHMNVGVFEPLAVTIGLRWACAGSWCSLWSTHPAIPVRCSLKQACREPVLFWKPGSFCKRAQYFNYSYLRQFLSQGFIFSHNKGWRKFSEWVMSLSLSLSGSEGCPVASVIYSNIVNQWAVMIFSDACCH